MKGRGFSLAEAMIVSFLLLILVGMMAGLAQEYSRVSRYLSGKDAQVSEALAILSSVGQEVQESVAGVAPASSTQVSVLEFDKVNLLANRYAGPPPASFRPLFPRLRIRYRLQNGQILREADDGSMVDTAVIGRGVSGFGARLTSPRTLLLSVSVQRQGTVLTLDREVFLVGGRW